MVRMDFPCHISSDIPRWPVAKRSREGNSLDIKTGPGLEISDDRLSLQIDNTLAFDADTLIVNPDVLKPYSERPVLVPGDFDSYYFRIPFILTLRNGDIIVGGDARGDRLDDFHYIRIGLAISHDGGLTWPTKVMPLVPEARTPDARFMDGCIVEDAQARIHLFAVYFENSNHITTLDENYDFVHVMSEDGGRSWTAPKSLKHLKRPGEKYFFQCPGVGITMQNGTVIVPCQCWLENDPYYTSTFIYLGKDSEGWQRAVGTTTVSTTECQIIEYPVPNQLLMIARRERQPSVAGLACRLIVSSSDFGRNWVPHYTNMTLRQRNPCQSSLIAINTPDHEWTALYCAPLNSFSDYSKGRQNVVLQQLPVNAPEWSLVGTVDSRVTLGYTGISFNSKYNKLFVLTEIAVPGGSALVLHDCSLMLSKMTNPYGYNINLGFDMVLNTQYVSHGRPANLKFRLCDDGSIWVGGSLQPKDAESSFPDNSVNLFELTLPFAVSNRNGWITAFASTTLPAQEVCVFLLEYYFYEKSGKIALLFRNFNNAVSQGKKFSAMRILYVPDQRVSVMC
nr:sialidase [Siadenovirus sp.]